MLNAAALLTAEESRASDKAAIASGSTGEKLMESAGNAVADVILQEYAPCSTLIICGPGNNGGDGFIVARILKEQGWPVLLAVIDEDFKGDAKLAKDKWNRSGGSTRTFTTDLIKECDLIVDAIFGTGLERPVEGAYKGAVQAINESKKPVVSIDIASGIDSDKGSVLGMAVKASHTVSFTRPKPGHILLPGKAYTGQLHVYDIGITGEKITPKFLLNAPVLWKSSFPFAKPEDHKYSRGHALVIGGGMSSTGAARLASLGALRSGAGLVSIVCSEEALPIYAMTMTSVMTKKADTINELKPLLEDKRITAALIGPGCGANETTREQVLHILSHKKATVIDADGLSAFKDAPKKLFSAITGPTVLTPHTGEFESLFSVTGSKTERAKAAAKESGAVVVLKGNDTVIAAPDGRIAINANAPVWLATAGSGDVLAGIVTGLLAQGMPAFEAACAATWIHGEAATQFGPGLIAEDIPGAMPNVFKQLYG